MAIATPYLVALLVAFIGLWVWRLQQLTLRKLAVAEEATTAMWEAADALRSARSRGIFAGEGSTYSARASDDEKATDTRRTYFVVRERLIAASDKFARLAGARSPVRYHLGDAALAEIDALFKIRWDVLMAVDMLMQHGPLMDPSREDHLKLMHTAFTSGEDDKLAARIDAVEKALEAICFKATRSAAAFFPRR